VWKRGRGNIIKFWEDSWIIDYSLINKYSRIYVNSIAKESIIGNMGKWDNGVLKWNLGWRRQWFEWEKNLVEDFMKVLEKENLDCTKDDEWSWIDDKVNTYSVKSAYEIIRNSNLGGEENCLLNYGKWKLYQRLYTLFEKCWLIEF